jgi:GT2 family glycosyltransferase
MVSRPGTEVAEGAIRPAARVEPATSRSAAPFDPVSPTELVTIVICTLGREPRLKDAVSAVLAQSYPQCEVVIVDNDPGSGRTRALLAGEHDSRLRLVSEPIRGLSAARNTGWRAARGTLIAYTDDDAAAEPDWIARLVDVLRGDRHGVVACVTGRVLAADITTEPQSWLEKAGVFDKGPVRRVWSLTQPQDHLGPPGRESPLLLITSGVMGSGNNMLFRAQALREVDGFDEALGAGSLARGGEDLDVFRRLLMHGCVVVYVPDAVVRHHHRTTYEALRRQLFNYGVGMASVLTKVVLHGGRPALTVLLGVPFGLRRLFSPRSPKNAQRPAEMPRRLIAVEALGYCAGPVLYLCSTGVSRRRRRQRNG